MYAQRRIMEELFGRAAMCLEAATGQALLRQHMADSGMVACHLLFPVLLLGFCLAHSFVRFLFATPL